MRVTALRTTALHVPRPRPIVNGLGPLTSAGMLLVHLDTDQGVAGENLVFTLNNKRLAVFDEMVRSLAPLVVGEDPHFSARFWSRAWIDVNSVGHAGVPVAGISAIDGALWNLRGKLAGLPVHRLIGAARGGVVHGPGVRAH